ncbi:sugar-binding transcriptional regulator [Rhodococcus opacus]|uniref:sugar-binding transcriptional regulator n=1 Tax=Rhodococcus opacus TaxID=37919 RepID=UPI002236B7DE|nr:sugar-binding domain-containing protein [Rhodococcus opacus]UZG60175.1 DNA-binding transcriptional regulator [Rhodococcus opacus]
MGPGPNDLVQQALVARRYYLEGRTRIQIADEFGISRFKVARILDDALTSGIVEIKVHTPDSIDIDLSSALKREYGLEHAYAVASKSPNTTDRVDAVAKTMAELLASILTPDDILGVDCGRTLTHVTGHLHTLAPCDIVQLTGMAGAITANSAELTRQMAEIGGGHCWPIYAPLVAPDDRTATALGRNRQIQQARAKHKLITCAIVSIGTWQPGTSQVYDSLTADEAQTLRSQGAAAETCALLVDRNGKRINAIDHRRIGIDEQTLRAIPTVIAIAAGHEKTESTRAVLSSGLVSSIITDTQIAAACLQH